MKLTRVLCGLLVAGSLFQASAKELDIIPRVSESKIQEGKFVLSSKTNIILGQTSEKSKSQMAFNVKQLEAFVPAKLSTKAKPNSVNSITLMISPMPYKEVKEGSYTLQITPNGIQITGVDAAGVFYGIQSLKQMLPSHAFKKRRKNIF